MDLKQWSILYVKVPNKVVEMIAEFGQELAVRQLGYF